MAIGGGGEGFVPRHRPRTSRDSSKAVKRRRIACQHCRQSKVFTIHAHYPGLYLSMAADHSVFELTLIL